MPFTLLLYSWLLVAGVMLILYGIQRKTKDASPVDVAWAANLGLLAVVYALFVDGYVPRQYLVLGMAGIWSVRLSVYLLLNRVIGKEEDGRYKSIREGWASKAQRFFFVFYQAQALLNVVLSLSFLTAMMNPKAFLDVWDWLAVVVFIISVLGESVADFQLARFRADPAHRGKTCRVGLWNYSRHPNYFFEWLHWWVYVFLAVGSPYWWITLLSPVLMLYFIFQITGIPATEAQALLSRKDDYKQYQQTTSVFVPWFPKRRR
jgi:steroid 5-alpha reductase family enzyme